MGLVVGCRVIYRMLFISLEAVSTFADVKMVKYISATVLMEYYWMHFSRREFFRGRFFSTQSKKERAANHLNRRLALSFKDETVFASSVTKYDIEVLLKLDILAFLNEKNSVATAARYHLLFD